MLNFVSYLCYQGTVPFMSAGLLSQIDQITKNNLSSPVGPPTRKSASTTHVYTDDNDTIVHTHADDIESLFYVLVWIVIRYDGPLGCERQFSNGEMTFLDRWSGVGDIGAASNSKMAFLLSQTREDDLRNQKSPYFKDLFKFVNGWRKVVAKNLTKGQAVTFSYVNPIFDRVLASMPDEKPTEMAMVMQDLITDHTNLA
jgi:hypothetical protein